MARVMGFEVGLALGLLVVFKEGLEVGWWVGAAACRLLPGPLPSILHVHAQVSCHNSDDSSCLAAAIPLSVYGA